MKTTHQEVDHEQPHALQQPDAQAEPTAVIFLRTRSVPHDPARDAESLVIQEEACTNEAADLGASISKVFVEHEGVPDGSARRAERFIMLRYLELFPTDYVIVHEISRLAGGPILTIQMALTIQAAGAELILASEDFQDSPTGTFVAYLLHLVEDGRERRAARIPTPKANCDA